MRSESPGTPRPQTADPPDDQVNLDAGRARPVELLDQGRIDEAVHLGDDPRWPSEPGVVRLAANTHHEPVAQIGRRDDQMGATIR
jgi:hypothetical protein